MAIWRALAVREGRADPISRDEIASALRAGCEVWLDLQDPDLSDVEALGVIFSFHHLALEDVARRGQRPKVDEYDDYYFFVLYAVAGQAEDELVSHELHCFWGPRYAVTVHRGAIREVDDVFARARTVGPRTRTSVAFLVYQLLDAVVDGYFPALDDLADRVDEIEDKVFTGDETLVRDALALRRRLIGLRRVLGPSRDVLNELLRRHLDVYDSDLNPYLTDVYDHVIRAIDSLDLQRDLLGSATDSYLSAASNRLNQTVRTMTALTLTIMLPTLIAGIYGMNYQLVPAETWESGFWFALGLMLATGTASLIVFRKVGWL